MNALARRHADELGRFLRAGAALRRAVAEAGDVQAAQRDERAALGELTGHARELVREAGSQPTDALLGKVRATLEAAVADEDAAAEVRAGRLARELEAPAFDAFAGLTVKRRPTPKPDRAREREELKAAKAQLRQAEAAERSARREWEAAQAALEAARAAVEKLER